MPRISEATIAEHRQRTESALLDAWEALLEEHGFNEITLAMVAERAGVARNTVYGYFPDKEHLLLAHLEREVATFVDELRRAVDAVTGGTERLRVVIEEQLRYFAEHPAARHDLAGAMDDATHARIMACFEPIHGLTIRILRDGMHERVFRELDPAATAQFVLALIGVYRIPVAARTTEPAQATQQIFDILLNGIDADTTS
jgi:AcrR family transcriptional regulator